MPNRRQSLIAIVSLLASVGLGAIATIFISTLKPTEAVILSHQKEIDLSHLRNGQILEVEWEGQQIYVLHRTPEQIEWLRTHPAPPLETNRILSLPHGASSLFRSLKPEFLVVSVSKIGSQFLLPESKFMMHRCDSFKYVADLGTLFPKQAFPGGFYCASAYGQDLTSGDQFNPWVYDPAGQTHSPWFAPLWVPPHLFKGKYLVLGNHG